MARGVNKVILIGNLGQDPEVKYMPSGNAVTNISVATSDQWTDKQTGQKQERTEWHRVVMFGKIAEIAGQYLRKGSKIYIEGALRTRKWQGQDGQDRYTTEVVVDMNGQMQMLDSRGGEGGGMNTDYSNDYQSGGMPPQGAPYQQPQYQQPAPQQQPPQQQAPRQAPQQPPRQSPQQPPQQPAPQPAQGFDNFDDDIPF